MTKQPHSEQYERARGAFDQLGIEDRAVFLIEAVVTTMADGVEKAGRALADELDWLFKKGKEQAADEGHSSTAKPPSEESRPTDASGADFNSET